MFLYNGRTDSDIDEIPRELERVENQMTLFCSYKNSQFTHTFVLLLIGLVINDFWNLR